MTDGMKRLDLRDVIDALADVAQTFALDVSIRPSRVGDHEVVVIEIQDREVAFDDLVMVSKALGTTRINVDSDVREGGYCETCAYSYTVTVLTVWDVVLPEN